MSRLEQGRFLSHCFLGAVAGYFSKGFIDPQDDVVAAGNHHAFLRLEGSSGNAQLLLGPFALGDVAGQAKQGGDVPLRIAQRDGVRVEPAVRALEADHLELQVAGLTLEHAPRQRHERLAVTRCDDPLHLLANYLLRKIRIDHIQSGAVHLQQGAVGGEQFDAFRLGFDDGVQPSVRSPRVFAQPACVR